jgi:hypothetical protein
MYALSMEAKNNLQTVEVFEHKSMDSSRIGAWRSQFYKDYTTRVDFKSSYSQASGPC